MELYDTNPTGEAYPEIILEGYMQKFNQFGDRLFLREDGDWRIELLPASPGAEKHGFGWGYNVYNVNGNDELFTTSHNIAYNTPSDADIGAKEALESMKTGN